MSIYQWKNVSFETPSSLVDETVVALVEDREESGYSITLADDELAAGADLEAYVAGATQELEQAADALRPIGQEPLKIGGHDAIRVEHDIEAGGDERHQVQVFVRSPGRVLVIAATATPEAKGRAKKALEAVLQTLKVS